MSLEWRIIDMGKKSGRFNTALDCSIMESVSKGNSKPTLVFSEWLPTVSLGNTQSYSLDVDAEASKKHLVEVVRRKSGGQAVYIDEGYIVFSIIAPKNIFPNDLTYIRKEISENVMEVLQDFGIPAEFYRPDNLIINQNESVRTLGNAGQIINSKAVVLHSSVRYKLVNFDIMLDVLQVNGEKINKYGGEIREILADVVSYNPKVRKDEIKNSLIRKFSEIYGVKMNLMNLRKDEYERTIELSEKNCELLKDSPTFKGKGVCYFFLDGRNLVPSLQNFLEYNLPSSVKDSIIQMEASING